MLIRISHVVKEKFFKLIWYSWKRAPFNITAVAVVDGRFYAGGLTDRFKGIVSLYAWAKSKNIPFRIEFTDPFDLSQYLIPNNYNWMVRDGDFVRSIRTADIIYAVSEPLIVNRLPKKTIKRQIHFYGNRDIFDSLMINPEKWGGVFKELFKPTENLQNSLDKCRAKLGSSYFAAVFRFQNLFGDFPEYNYKPIESEQERNNLLRKCISEVKELINKEQGKICLVTSDSKYFLTEVETIDGVKIISGDVVHPGTKITGNYRLYEKSFIDFYMISESSKVYSIVCDNMYPSEFPLYASKLNNIPFERIYL